MFYCWNVILSSSHFAWTKKPLLLFLPVSAASFQPCLSYVRFSVSSTFPTEIKARVSVKLCHWLHKEGIRKQTNDMKRKTKQNQGKKKTTTIPKQQQQKNPNQIKTTKNPNHQNKPNQKTNKPNQNNPREILLERTMFLPCVYHFYLHTSLSPLELSKKSKTYWPWSISFYFFQQRSNLLPDNLIVWY